MALGHVHGADVEPSVAGDGRAECETDAALSRRVAMA